MSDDSDDSDDERDFPTFEEHGDERRRGFERSMPEVFRRVIERAVEHGVEKITEAPDNIREIMGDIKLPKEASGYVYEQIDDTKKGIYKIVAKEIRDVLEHINFADEIADVLTKLQFEINTTIRFVPNEGPETDEGAEDTDEGADSGSDDKKSKRPSRIPRPKVVSKVVMKAKEALKPKD